MPARAAYGQDNGGNRSDEKQREIAEADGAVARYHFDVWTTDNGLPQNSVSAILQTRDGFLWLTTNDGLVRYDGVNFTIDIIGYKVLVNLSIPSNSGLVELSASLWSGRAACPRE